MPSGVQPEASTPPDTAIRPVPRPDLQELLAPRSIAVVGVSSRPESAPQGATNGFVAALLEQGFDGPLYPCNPRLTEFLGLPCYPSLRDVPAQQIDYVISGVPSSGVLDLLDACAEKRVRLITFFTSGFSETDDPDRMGLERQLAAKAKAAGIRVIGPNCMGLYNPRAHVSFSSTFPKEPGSVAFVSQSGANASEFIRIATARGLRCSFVVSYGNAVDLSEADFFELAGSDPNTTVVAGYIEGVRDGPRFARALRAAGLRKPTAVLKGGRTEEGGRAAHSHTGSMAGSLRVFDALCRQAAAARVSGLDELIDLCVAFSFLSDALSGRNVAVVGGGGGPSVLAADDIGSAGLGLPPLGSATQTALREFTPVAGTSVRNPVDTTVFLEPDLMRRTVEIVAADPAVDLILCQTGFEPFPGQPASSPEAQAERALAPVRGIAQAAGKPLAFVARQPATPEGYAAMLRFQEMAASESFATFPSIARAARAVAAVFERRELLAGG